MTSSSSVVLEEEEDEERTVDKYQILPVEEIPVSSADNGCLQASAPRKEFMIQTEVETVYCDGDLGVVPTAFFALKGSSSSVKIRRKPWIHLEETAAVGSNYNVSLEMVEFDLGCSYRYNGEHMGTSCEIEVEDSPIKEVICSTQSGDPTAVEEVDSWEVRQKGCRRSTMKAETMERSLKDLITESSASNTFQSTFEKEQKGEERKRFLELVHEQEEANDERLCRRTVSSVAYRAPHSARLRSLPSLSPNSLVREQDMDLLWQQYNDTASFLQECSTLEANSVTIAALLAGSKVSHNDPCKVLNAVYDNSSSRSARVHFSDCNSGGRSSSGAKALLELIEEEEAANAAYPRRKSKAGHGFWHSCDWRRRLCGFLHCFHT